MASLAALNRTDYPRASTYDGKWLVESDMGPNPLWLLEDLAREFGVRVWATDLWVSADEAAATFEAHGVGDAVTAIKAEAHALPFAAGFFDVIVCIDAYEYFGTADGYLAYLTRFLKPGGQLAIATPAMTREVRELGHIPPHIKACVGWEAIAWHTAEWWRFHWNITELVTVTAARTQVSGWRDWLTWAQVCAEYRGGSDPSLEMLEADQGEYLTFALVTARKPAPA